MPDHPDVLLTPAQARQVRWAFAYQQPPALAAKFLGFAEAVLALAVALVQLPPSAERDCALEALQEASMRIQAVFMLEEGTPLPPSWLHVVVPEATP
jgi:replication-associated recombination protein RarA